MMTISELPDFEMPFVTAAVAAEPDLRAARP